MDIYGVPQLFLPVLGPAVGAWDAAWLGDRVGAAVGACGVAVDVCTVAGGGGLMTGAKSLMSRAGLVRSASRSASIRGTVRLLGRCAVSLTSPAAARVAKTVLKQNFRRKVRLASLKVGMAAACAVTERRFEVADMTCDLAARLTHYNRRVVPAKIRRRVWASSRSFAHRSSAAFLRVPGAQDAIRAILPLAVRPPSFADAILRTRPLSEDASHGDGLPRSAIADARLHALFAEAVYEAPAMRRGITPNHGGDPEDQRNDWYTYISGDTRRGFWYSAASRHLVLAERGTDMWDVEDLSRDTVLALGISQQAVSGRAEASVKELEQQLVSQDCRWLTIVGHSLGGTVAAEVADLVFRADRARSAEAGEGIHIDAVHLFNPGGVPDVSRVLALLTHRAGSELHVHRIQGDVLSAGFLPLVRGHSHHSLYAKRCGHESTSPHALVHFLDD